MLALHKVPSAPNGVSPLGDTPFGCVGTTAFNETLYWRQLGNHIRSAIAAWLIGRKA